jgi:hypothetical protein
MSTMDQLINTVVAGHKGLMPNARNLDIVHDPVLDASTSDSHNLPPEESVYVILAS